MKILLQIECMNISNRNFKENIAKISSQGDVTGRVEVRCGPRQINIKRPPHQSVNFRIGTLNVGTMKGRASDITETVDVLIFVAFRKQDRVVV